MHATCWRTTVLAVGVLLGGCRGERREADPAPGTVGAAFDTTTLAGATAQQLAALRAGVALSAWRGAQPADSVHPFTYDSTFLAFGGWCARAVARVAAGRLARHAFFYPPPAPTPASPPPVRSGPQATGDCVLGAVAVAAPPPGDHAQSRALAQELDSALRLLVGPGAYHIAMASDGGVVVSRSLPASGLGANLSTPPDSAWRAFLDWKPLALERGAQLAGLDRALWTPLDRAADQVAAAGTTVLDAAALAAALQDWLAAARELPPPRQAAALYAADGVLVRTACAAGLCGSDSTRLAPFQALGAEFVNQGMEGPEWRPAGAWLRAARQLDADSVAGQAAFFVLLREALDEQGIVGVCSQDFRQYRESLASGERYLARGGPKHFAAQVHLLLAEAYRDLVALVSGITSYMEVPGSLTAERAEFVRRALAHYVAFLASGETSDMAPSAWQDAWRLAGGLLPSRVRLLCDSQ